MELKRIPPIEPNNLLKWMKYDKHYENQMVNSDNKSINDIDKANQVSRRFRLMDDE